MTESLRFAYARGLALGADDGADTGFGAHFSEEFRQSRGVTHGGRTLAALLDRAPEFGKLGSRRVPRAWRALRGRRVLSPARSRRPRPRSTWAAGIHECARRDRLRLGR